MSSQTAPGPARPAPPWWKGSRGEWFAIAQVVLMVLIFLGPRNLPGWPGWPPPAARFGSIAGGLLILLGGALFLAGLFSLGGNLTPLPHPKEESTLVETGAYALARHPMYGGGLLAALGWALMAHGWLTLLYVIVAAVFFDIKSRREERWLMERFPGYGEYRKRVRRLIPFVY